MTCSSCGITFPVIEVELREQPSLFPSAFCRIYLYNIFSRSLFFFLMSKNLSDRTSVISLERVSHAPNDYILKDTCWDTFFFPCSDMEKSFRNLMKLKLTTVSRNNSEDIFLCDNEILSPQL